MVVADAVIHGPRDRLLGFNPAEHPVALQIGGSEGQKLAQAARIGQDFGYDEININIGCPSDRVQSGRFGACLMTEPDLVADCYAAMADAVDIPVTVKCRLGVDDQDEAKTLPEFLDKVSRSGCQDFIIHARKAWLKGLSPKENRDVPPLNYALVREMKLQFPHLSISLNGGLKQLDEAYRACQIEKPCQIEKTCHIKDANITALDGIMLGRAAYHNPWILTQIDSFFHGQKPFNLSRFDVLDRLIDYAQQQQETDPTTKALIRHIMGLFAGQKGARLWRRSLSEGLISKAPPATIIMQAMQDMKSIAYAA